MISDLRTFQTLMAIYHIHQIYVGQDVMKLKI
jgi:hypothetical protein